jgi:hypothetical protein
MRGFWQRRNPFPPTQANGRSPAEITCDGLSISPGVGTPGVNGDGRRELLGLKVGNSESEAFWAEFIAHLTERAWMASSWRSQMLTPV